MRIVIAGPPKSGNIWLRHLLAWIYNLEIIPSGPPTNDAFEHHIASGGFPGDAICIRHVLPSYGFLRIARSLSCHLITIIRDPYDTFVSRYFHLQSSLAHPALFQDDQLAAMIGKPIDHPDVLAYLQESYGWTLDATNAWVQSGASHVMRYEGLISSPFWNLKFLTDQIELVEDERIERAIAECAPERMRVIDETMALHVRTATVGDWRKHLTEAHLAIFRDHHADVIRCLRYPVR